MRKEFPIAGRGMRVGLLGGSFDPPHAGHVRLTKTALIRFGLDQVWWLVSPGNPLKTRGPAPLPERMQAARALMQHPQVKVSDIEARLGTRYTSETLARLVMLYPEVRFCWLMGADNLASLHRWQNWHGIMGNIPVGVVARPGDRISARLSKAARIYRFARLRGREAALLGAADAPAWSFINMPMSDQSSTAIRGRGEWN